VEYEDKISAENILFRPNVPVEMREGYRANLKGYYTHIVALDKCVGDLMDTLDELQLTDNTILVFASGHGEKMSCS
jgi:arylsulfatase A-like enzyme